MVLFAYLDAELVSTGFLTRQELIDTVAVGQFTPGPVLSTATFIGWQLNGFWGAIAATVGIFLPSFIFVAILNPLIPKMPKSKIIAAFLDAVNIAAVAVIVAVCVEMGKDTLTDWRTILIAVLSIIAVFVFKKMNSAFIVIGGALTGYLLTLIWEISFWHYISSSKGSMLILWCFCYPTNTRTHNRWTKTPTPPTLQGKNRQLSSTPEN